jgi:hypothetical protein
MPTSLELGKEKIASEGKRKMKTTPLAQNNKKSRVVKNNYYFIQ